MDFLKQTKLSKSEWDSLEVPPPENEKRILHLINDGYTNTKIIANYTENMISFSKLPYNDGMHHYIYTKYFQETVNALKGKYKISFEIETKGIKKLKSADTIRIQNMDQTIQNNKNDIYEFMCMELCRSFLKKKDKKIDCSSELYTLIQWRKATIVNNNVHVMKFVDTIIANGKEFLSINQIIKNAPIIIEKNTDLYKCDDLALHPHQKDIFTFCRTQYNKPKLVLYTAPTGTGKTLTPIGLSQGYKIIFVCVARHIGLALAKCAIGVGKRVAFAFGCETASDIRLHYFSAVDYERNKRSGGIGKVDNSNGSAVEIMICDVQSYLIAMYYMQSFNPNNNLLMYWDEPTMTLDYESHPIHETLHELWSKNTVPNVVLSCATLPNEQDIQECIHDFRANFMGAEIHTITSYDCKKSIPIINTEGYCFMPHINCDTLQKLQDYSRFCNENKTLLRYFDLEKTVEFILIFNSSLDNSNHYHMNNYFADISEITMNNLKLYYLELLFQLDEKKWETINTFTKNNNSKKYAQKTADKNALTRMQSLPNLETTPSSPSQTEVTRTSSESRVSELQDNVNKALAGVLLTTKDAHTLTDGPTIYLADNLLNLAKFYIKQSEIPERLLSQLIDQIKMNDKLQEAIESLEEQLEQKLKVKDNTDVNATSATGNNRKTTKKQPNEKAGTDENTQVLKDNIEHMKKQLCHLSLKPEYIPNRPEHQLRWIKKTKTSPFSQDVDENTVKEIMELDIHTHYKILVLMGIGVLIKQENKKYEEIVKRLALEQKLYLILASSDFIYGTNYQFCHGFIGKDLPDMTPQKILQSMGRIGRNSSQQDYSVRFRNDAMIHKLFQTPEHNREANNMNTLLCHD